MFSGRRPFADIAGLLAPARINRLVHTVSVMVDPDLTYRYPCPTAFGACHYIYPTMAFFFLYAMALSCLWPIARDRATKPSGPQTHDQPYSDTYLLQTCHFRGARAVTSLVERALSFRSQKLVDGM
jgi:hypothetical protein